LGVSGLLFTSTGRLRRPHQLVNGHGYEAEIKCTAAKRPGQYEEIKFKIDHFLSSKENNMKQKHRSSIPHPCKYKNGIT
jgi:hypothetical protein